MAEEMEKYPFVEVTSAPDRMKAFLNIVSAGDGELDITAEYLKGELQRQGVIHGIHEPALEEVVKTWNRNRRIAGNVLVAEGKSQHTQSQKGPMLEVKGITDHTLYAEVLKLKIKHYWEVMKIVVFEPVMRGDVVMKKLDEEVAVSGMTVYGEEIKSSQASLLAIEEGYGIHYDLGRRAYLASENGVACLIGKKLEVLPVICEGHVEIEIDREMMNAVGTIYPPYKMLKPVTEEDLAMEMKKLMIRAGVDVEGARAAVRQCLKEKKIVTVTLAHGKSPVPGRDARIEILINFEESLKPQINDKGVADFRNVSIIKSVKKGDLLARHHPPTRGVSGVNLQGVALPAPDGRDLKLPQGLNTEIPKDTPELMVAAVAGSARMNGTLVEVVECYVVHGDVDYGTGNIDFPKTVVVNGDVKSGFTVQVGGDLEVTGLVEECQVTAGGNVLVKAGFIGSGGGLIEAKGNVSLGFVRNQKIRCRKDIHISGEAINSQMFARGSIEVGGGTLGIVGGTVSARKEIICETAGNDMGTKTQLEVGIDFALIEEKFSTEGKIKELTGSRVKIEKHMEKLLHIKKVRRELPASEAMILKKLVEMDIKVKQQLSILEERLKLIMQKLSAIDKARILVKRKIYRGVTIKIGDNYLNIDEDLEGPKNFIMRDERVKIC